jgi:hypothetical protein
VWKWQRVKAKAEGKVNPLWIIGEDQIDFPIPVPVFELLFASDCVCHVIKHFISDEAENAVSRRKTFCGLGPVLMHSAQQIGRHANIERPSILTCEDVNTGTFSHVQLHSKGALQAELVSAPRHPRELCDQAAPWTLKQVQGDDAS